MLAGAAVKSEYLYVAMQYCVIVVSTAPQLAMADAVPGEKKEISLTSAVKWNIMIKTEKRGRLGV